MCGVWWAGVGLAESGSPRSLIGKVQAHLRALWEQALVNSDRNQGLKICVEVDGSPPVVTVSSGTYDMPYYGRVVDLAAARVIKKSCLMPLGVVHKQQLFVDGSKHMNLMKSE
eukprot:4602413-Alexandrium_andersonii.AAC.1